jgi:Monooxygenase af470-like
VSTAPNGAGGAGGYDGATIAHLWEHPTLCVAIFGVQFHTPEGQRRYEASGISEEMFPALEAAHDAGFLHQELLLPPQGGGAVLLQYWRSYDDLDRWARVLPHMRWWRWLLENAGEDLSFWHEIYQAKTAEAIFEKGCKPVGPARFAATSPVAAGSGQSRQRQERFAEAAAPVQTG